MLLALLPATLSAESVSLQSKALAVTVDTDFPRILGYRMAGQSVAGQASPTSAVEVNGKAEPCHIAFRKTASNSAEYALDFPQAQIRLRLVLTVSDNAVELRTAGIEEMGATKMRTLFFPGNALLTLSESDAAIAAVHSTTVHDDYRGEFREHIGPLSGMKPEEDSGNYFFASTGKLAFGVGSNHPVDVERVAWKIAGDGAAKTCTAWSPAWLCRGDDGERTDLPWTKIFVTTDANGDGSANWQDAALVFRSNMPKPYGSEFVRTTVGENVAMNFASCAQQPFLRILDNVKRAYLVTDGLGQQVIIKGFSSEGHDSANSDYAGHWNERAGGLKDLTTLLENAGRYNARIGIHINVSEVYPEAHRYNPEILQLDAKGNLKPGWCWLDQAYMIDKRKDLLSGNLFATLDQMHHDLPKLSFVYVDTYWDNGWPAWKLVHKLSELGLPFYTEGTPHLDPWSTWAHWRGASSAVMHFLWYSDRDIFVNDAILRGGRGDDDGFMGWQNQHTFQNYVRNTFTRHLPAKYLKRFELLRWEPGKEADFSGGVKVINDGVVTVTQQGRKVMSWKGGGAETRMCVPWDGKIYLWDDANGSVEWELPPDWATLKTVYLYPLSDRGRGTGIPVPVEQGKVKVEIAKGAPYVLYRNPAPAPLDMEWGKGSPVKDPGFCSYSLDAWNVSGKARVEADGHGNPRLRLSGSASQELTALEPGKTYAASVWALGSGKGGASLTVRAGGKEFTNHVTRFNVPHHLPNDPRSGTNYQRLKVIFDLPATASKATLVLSAPDGGEFDDIRVVEIRRSPEASQHWFWEDFENVDMGYGPFAWCSGERTHLSESNPPYTTDTISGRFSLKSRDSRRVLRTLPSTLRFKPATRYRLHCRTMGDGHFAVEDGNGPLAEMKFSGASGEAKGEFATGDDEDAYLSLYKDSGDAIVIDDLAIDELGPAPVASVTVADDSLPNLRVLWQEAFNQSLEKNWTSTLSKHEGVSAEARGGALTIRAAANDSAFVEHALPASASAVACQFDNIFEQGQTWGAGLCLLWSDGAALRVNMRGPDARFGIDSTFAGQIIAGRLSGSRKVTLRIRLDDNEWKIEARNGTGPWQALGAVPKEKLQGFPVRLRIGKTHGATGTDDNADPGPAGSVDVTMLRVYGQ